MSDNESNERRETVADIVAAMCAQAKVSETFMDRLFSNPCLRMEMEMKAKLRNSLADRLEAAWKRDEERAVEHATRHAEAVARDNCRDCVHNPRGHNYEGGNAAAMREALVQCELFLGNVLRHGHQTLNPGDKCTACNGVDELRGMVVRALSSPARYCDVMSVESAKKLWFVKEIMPRLDGDLPLGKEIPFEEWFVSKQEQGECDGR